MLATRASHYDWHLVRTRDSVSAEGLKLPTDGLARTGLPSPAKRKAPRNSDMRARVVAKLQTMEDLLQARAVANALFALSELGEPEEGNSDNEGFAAFNNPPASTLGRNRTPFRSCTRGGREKTGALGNRRHQLRASWGERRMDDDKRNRLS